MYAALHRHEGALAEAALDGSTDAERMTLPGLLERVRGLGGRADATLTFDMAAV